MAIDDFFKEEKNEIIKLSKEKGDDLIEQLTPIIQQWVLTDILYKARMSYGLDEYYIKGEIFKIKKHYIEIIHALLNYKEDEDVPRTE